MTVLEKSWASKRCSEDRPKYTFTPCTSFFQQHFAKLDHRDLLCDPHTIASYDEMSNLRSRSVRRAGGFVQTPLAPLTVLCRFQRMLSGFKGVILAVPHKRQLPPGLYKSKPPF